jgi:capsular polysaccharide transport system permease protein
VERDPAQELSETASGGAPESRAAASGQAGAPQTGPEGRAPAQDRPAVPSRKGAEPDTGLRSERLPSEPATSPATGAPPAPTKAAGMSALDRKPVGAERLKTPPRRPVVTGAAAGRIPDAPPLAPPARTRPRHWLLLATFLLVVALPTAMAAWYLYTRAVDQYASITAFSVRSDDSRSALDILGGLGSIATGGGARDSEILYQFIQSQELVARIDARLDLRSLYSRHHATDPLFAFDPSGTIEDLTEHWARMLRIAFDDGTGLMELRVLAFDPAEAQAIARAILEESTQRINELSAIARDDATRYAREDLETALDRLRNAREALTQFRIRTRIVDPSADIQGQMGLLNTLQAQLAEALIELDLLRENTREGDQRIVQAERRIEVIRDRIEEERALFGGGAVGPAGEDYATVVAEFERLNVDREFAEQAYRSAQSAYDAALAQAQRSSIYLATHVIPTQAESARYPERETLLGLTGFFLLLVWAVGALIFYSVRDSR